MFETAKFKACDFRSRELSRYFMLLRAGGTETILRNELSSTGATLRQPLARRWYRFIPKNKYNAEPIIGRITKVCSQRIAERGSRLNTTACPAVRIPTKIEMIATNHCQSSEEKEIMSLANPICRDYDPSFYLFLSEELVYRESLFLLLSPPPWSHL